MGFSRGGEATELLFHVACIVITEVRTDFHFGKLINSNEYLCMISVFPPQISCDDDDTSTVTCTCFSGCTRGNERRLE